MDKLFTDLDSALGGSVRSPTPSVALGRDEL
jgi:hypothetical protein